MRLKCVIFDFDRTLVNLLDFTDWNRARILVAKSYLKNQVPKTLIAKHNRGPFRLFYNVYYELAPTCPEGKLKEIQLEASKSLEKFEVEGAFKAELMLGAYETLKWIKKHGIRVGIVSTNSRSSIEVAASRLEIADFIDVVIGRYPLPERMKPYPHQVLACLRKLAYKPNETMMVGDGCNDILAAKQCDIFAVAVLTGRTSREELLKAGANKIIKNLFELPKLILETFAYNI